MKKEKILQKIKEVIELLEMTNENYAEKYGKKFNRIIKAEEVYPHKTGVVIAMLKRILEESKGGRQ